MTGVIRHVVVFNWVEGTTAEQVRALEAGLAALPGQIPQIRSYDFGPDAGLGAGLGGNGDFAVVATFDDEDGYGAYAAHPAHQAVVVGLLAPILAARHAVQVRS